MWWFWFIEQRRSPSRRSFQEEQEDDEARCLLGSHTRKSRNTGSIRKSLAHCPFAFTHVLSCWILLTVGQFLIMGNLIYLKDEDLSENWTSENQLRREYAVEENCLWASWQEKQNSDVNIREFNYTHSQTRCGPRIHRRFLHVRVKPSVRNIYSPWIFTWDSRI